MDALLDVQRFDRRLPLCSIVASLLQTCFVWFLPVRVEIHSATLPTIVPLWPTRWCFVKAWCVTWVVVFIPSNLVGRKHNLRQSFRNAFAVCNVAFAREIYHRSFRELWRTYVFADFYRFAFAITRFAFASHHVAGRLNLGTSLLTRAVRGWNSSS